MGSVGDHWTHIGIEFLKIGIMMGYISRCGTHNETKLPKKEILMAAMGPTREHNLQKRKF